MSILCIFGKLCQTIAFSALAPLFKNLGVYSAKEMFSQRNVRRGHYDELCSADKTGFQIGICSQSHHHRDQQQHQFYTNFVKSTVTFFFLA